MYLDYRRAEGIGRRDTLGMGYPMRQFISRFLRDESAATAIEYGLVACLIAVVIVAAVTHVSTNLGTKFNTIATNLS
jgi:pilus assembly protein Flp/PilA